MKLSDIVKTAIDGKIDRLWVGSALADLTQSAITLGYIMPGGEPTVRGREYLAEKEGETVCPTMAAKKRAIHHALRRETMHMRLDHICRTLGIDVEQMKSTKEKTDE